MPILYDTTQLQQPNPPNPKGWNVGSKTQSVEFANLSHWDLLISIEGRSDVLLPAFANQPLMVGMQGANIQVTPRKAAISFPTQDLSQEYVNYTELFLAVETGSTPLALLPVYTSVVNIGNTPQVELMAETTVNIGNTPAVTVESGAVNVMNASLDVNSNILNEYVSTNSVVKLGTQTLNITNLAAGAYSADFSQSGDMALYDGFVAVINSANGYSYDLAPSSKGWNASVADKLGVTGDVITNQYGLNGLSLATDTLAAPFTFDTVSGSLTPTGYQDVPITNPDFETVTGTATVFRDALISYSGTYTAGQTFGPWTVQSGSVTGGASGVTSGANGTLITAGNAQWRPVVASDGSTKLTLTVNAVVNPTTSPITTQVLLWKDTNNQYFAVMGSDSTFAIHKVVSGTNTTLKSVSQSQTASTSYYITLSLDTAGNLAAKLYQGTSSAGTLLQTLTATDTSLSGSFTEGIHGDTGVVLSSASVTAPWADSWGIHGNSRIAWALSQDSIAGKYSACFNNAGGFTGNISNVKTQLEIGISYTLSVYTSMDNGMADIRVSNDSTNGALGGQTNVQGKDNTRYSQTFIPDNGVADMTLETGSVSSGKFDSIQLEQSNAPTVPTDTVTLDLYAIKASVQAYAPEVTPINTSSVHGNVIQSGQIDAPAGTATITTLDGSANVVIKKILISGQNSTLNATTSIGANVEIEIGGTYVAFLPIDGLAVGQWMHPVEIDLGDGVATTSTGLVIGVSPGGTSGSFTVYPTFTTK